MEFRLEFKPNIIEPKLKLSDKIMLLGSCFTEHMFERLHHYKFNAIQNPHGTLFNPSSIHDALRQYINNQTIHQDELFEQNSLWNHWNFHSSLSHHQKEIALANMHEAISKGHEYLSTANWLIITFGSAFVYETENKVVANCHKIPASRFKKYMLWPDEIAMQYEKLITDLKSFNSNLHILFTVSPVRHLKDGFIENNRSKGSLLLAIEKMVHAHTHCHYFPSYELLIDDLRDYRFYAEDMVHPNYLATRYVWEKFSVSAIDGKTREVFKEIDQLNAAMKHKAMHPGSKDHVKFMEKCRLTLAELQSRFPQLDLQQEATYFNSN